MFVFPALYILKSNKNSFLMNDDLYLKKKSYSFFKIKKNTFAHLFSFIQTIKEPSESIINDVLMRMYVFMGLISKVLYI